MSKMPENSALISEKQLESLNSAQALFCSTDGPDDGIFRAETVLLENSRNVHAKSIPGRSRRVPGPLHLRLVGRYRLSLSTDLAAKGLKQPSTAPGQAV